MRCSQAKDVLFFNELESYSNLIVIKNSPQKCYTSVTFGVQKVSATNPVTVRVHGRFFFDFSLEKNNLAESVTFCKRAINHLTDISSFS